MADSLVEAEKDIDTVTLAVSVADGENVGDVVVVGVPEAVSERVADSVREAVEVVERDTVLVQQQ